MILGLDLSTSRVGLAVLKENGDLAFCDNIKMDSKSTLEARCLNLEEYITKLPYEFKHVFIEAPFMMFSSGKTTANTMAKLQRFNGMCSYMVIKSLNLHPVLIPANKARKLVGIITKRGTCTKTRVINFIEAKYSNFQVYYTRHGNPKPGTDDMADAIVIALSGLQMEKTNNE